MLTLINNLQCLLMLPIFNKTRLVAFHLTLTQRNYTNWFLPVRENESAHDLDSLHATMKMIATKCSPKPNNTKLWHFDAAAWINFTITLLDILLFRYTESRNVIVLVIAFWSRIVTSSLVSALLWWRWWPRRWEGRRCPWASSTATAEDWLTPTPTAQSDLRKKIFSDSSLADCVLLKTYQNPR